MIKTDTQFPCGTLNSSLLKITCIFWLSAKLISWKLWTACRLYPLAPVSEIFDRVPPFVHLILFITSLLLITLLLFTENKSVFIALLIVELASCLLDQNRWRSWEYQCLVTLVAFIVNTKTPKNVLAIFSLILISTYFYSGFGKLNPGFLNNVWGYMILKLFLKIPVSIASQYWVHYSGYLLALFELCAGLGLLFTRTQKAAAITLITMHLLLLVLLGPFGLNYNKVVWPWNIAMPFFLYLIFLGNAKTKPDFRLVLQGWNRLIFIFLAILPAFHFLGYWDAALSSNMYSGNSPGMAICIQDTTQCSDLKPFYSPYKNNKKGCTGEAAIWLQDWAILETNVSAYAELRVYNIIQRKLQKQYPGANFSYQVYVGNKK
jgi:hypothetical protein